MTILCIPKITDIELDLLKLFESVIGVCFFRETLGLFMSVSRLLCLNCCRSVYHVKLPSARLSNTPKLCVASVVLTVDDDDFRLVELNNELSSLTNDDRLF